MTYASFLAIFLVLPILVFAFFNWRRLDSGEIASIAGLTVIALLYTPLWDNYLVAERIWWYDPERVLGITLGWVPLEEYTFFILQPFAVGLWLLRLMRHLTPASDFNVLPMLRVLSVAGLFLPWLVSLVALLLGWRSTTYLALILAWSLPPIMLQLGFGADILWHRRRVVFAAILSSTLYLAIADGIAISIGIWTIAPETSLEIYLAGVLPIEEFVFFLVTNVLIVGGITLLQSRQSQLRMNAYAHRLRNLVSRAYGGNESAV